MADDYYSDDALPFHYRDNGQPCPWSGHVLASCPNGCDHAEHYTNDGHRGCEGPLPVGNWVEG